MVRLIDDVSPRLYTRFCCVHMSDNRWEDISLLIQDNTNNLLLGERIVRTAGELMNSTSNSVTVWSVPLFLTLAASDARAALLDQKQMATGEGPVFDVREVDTPAYTPDVTGVDCAQRWPIFSGDLHEQNIASVFCFPLQAGSAHLGAITVYRDVVGAPTPAMYRDGLILASLATEAILLLKAGTSDDMLVADFQLALISDAQLQQAAGIVSEYFNIPITDAMILIRSKAFGSDYSLSELARVIVHRELSLKDW
jgi:hypothetical protein